MDLINNCVCRTCLSRAELKSVFEKTCYSNSTEFNKLFIFEMIMECTSVKILENDTLPSKICDNCIKHLAQAYAFKKQCENADEILRLHCGKNRDEKTFLQNISGVNTESPFFFCKVKLEASKDMLEIGDTVNYDTSVSCGRIAKLVEEFKHDTKLESNNDRNTNVNSIDKNTATAEDFAFKDNTSDSNFGMKTELVDRSERERSKKCKKSGDKQASFQQSIRDRGKKKSQACHICNKEFAQNWLLEYHLKVHSGETPFMCDICGKSFRATNLLNFHIRQKHSPDDGSVDRSYVCIDCDKRFSSLRGLKEHRQRHGLRKYLCHECGKGFIKRTEMEKHSRVHTGVKPFACPVCKKAFAQLGALKTHSYLHSGEKPFQCKLCDRAFKLRHHLTDHTRTHSGEKPFCCTICHKSFPYEKSLIVHKRTHTR